jgi:hypothetical protein
MNEVLIAFFIGLGAAIWVYRKFARRATGSDFVKTLAPAFISGLVIFLVALTILKTIFSQN